MTGATGMIGRSLVDRLLAEGVSVRILARPSSDIRYLRTLPVDVIQGEADDREALRRSARGCQWVFHVAGLIRPEYVFDRGHDFSPLLRTNVDFTEAMLDASAQENITRFFYVSSTSVYGIGAAVPISERVPVNPCSDYGVSKVMAEAHVLAYQAKGMATTIIRPSIVYGPHDRHLIRLAGSLARLPIMPLPDGGHSLQDLVFVGDVVELIWLSSQSDVAINKVYNAGSDAPLSLREMLLSMRAFIGKPTRAFSISSELLLRAAFLAKGSLKSIAPGLETILTPVGLAYLSGDLYYDVSLAREELNFDPKVDFKQGLKFIFDPPHKRIQD